MLGGETPEKFGFAFYLLDRVAKLSPEQRTKLYGENAIEERQRTFFEQLAAGRDPLAADFWNGLGVAAAAFEGYVAAIAAAREVIDKTLECMGHGGCCRYDASIVRGLAYYTGFVWEVADARGENRAVAGGGRYDKLIEMFGGPSLPATGFGMGDVVLAILLQELGRLPAALTGGQADVYIANALAHADEALRLAGALRASVWDAAKKCVAEPGLSVSLSYKATKNIGKLLQDAASSGAKAAVILAPAEWERGVVKVKNLMTREEIEMPREEVISRVRGMVKAEK
jgi:histidyl-tRNA synthetase